MLNVVTIMGRLTADPDLRAPATLVGKDYCMFTLAVERDYIPAGGDKRPTDFIDCVVYGDTARFFSRNFIKGKMCAVSGRIENLVAIKDGHERKHTRVVVRDVWFAGDKKTEEREADYE